MWSQKIKTLYDYDLDSWALKDKKFGFIIPLGNWEVLQNNWKGLYEIVKKINDVVYYIIFIET